MNTPPIHTARIGPDGDVLLLAKRSDWVKNPADNVVVVCRDGWVDLSEMR